MFSYIDEATLVVYWLKDQLTALLQLQGYGRALWLMQGMFRSNGECGFVKKPEFLMERKPNNEVFNPKVELPVKKTLKVIHH